MLPCAPPEFLREHLGPPTLELAEGLLEAAQRDALGAAGHLDCSGMPELSTSRHVAEWKAVTCHRTPRSGKRSLSESRDFHNHRKTFVEIRNPIPFTSFILTSTRSKNLPRTELNIGRCHRSSNFHPIREITAA